MPPRRSNSKPLPPLLPTEILLDIFSFCSPRTLVQVARCSKEFLALASPVLYGRIRIDQSAQLFNLFSRKPASLKGGAKQRWASVRQGLWSGSQAASNPFAPLLPPPALLPCLSLAQVHHLHLVLPLPSPTPTFQFPYSRLLNTGTSSLNLNTLTITSAQPAVRFTRADQGVWPYIKARHLILHLLPEEYSAAQQLRVWGECYGRVVDPPRVPMGMREVTAIVDLARGTPVPLRPEMLLTGALAPTDGSHGVVRFVFHTRDGRGGFGRNVLGEYLSEMVRIEAMPARAWAGRVVLDVGSEEEAEEVRRWVEERQDKGEGEIRVVVRESPIGWGGGLVGGEWKKREESFKGISRVGSFVGSFRSGS